MPTYNHFYEIKLNSDIFDAVALLYKELIENIQNHELEFLSIYMDPKIVHDSDISGKKIHNPNLPKLDELATYVHHSIAGDEFNFDEKWLQIIEYAQKLTLIEYQNATMNRLTVHFTLLTSLDSIIMGILLNKDSEVYPISGPLNRIENSQYAVYLKNQKSLISSEEEELNFRNKSIPETIQKNLNVFQILDKTSWKSSVPIIRKVSLSKNLIDRQKIDKNLRIAITPYSNNIYFNLKNDYGSSVYFEYSIENEDIWFNRTKNFIDRALDNHSNIIMLPEYSVSPYSLQKIQEYITNLRKEKDIRLKDLIMIWAGTTWTKENNNVLNVISPKGDIIGRYFKYSSFTKKNSTNNHEGYYDIVELLTDPGGECTIFDIDKIGRFLPSICRDTIDDQYTNLLTKNFSPNFILVPAWSPSISEFERHFMMYGTFNHITSILCNSCSAIKNQSDSIGFMMYPSMNKSKIMCTKTIFPGSLDCRHPCEEDACMLMLTANYSNLDDGGEHIWNCSKI